MQRIFNPLLKDHPLVTGRETCPLCKELFVEGERVMLTPARTPQEGVETMPAIATHARCALDGAKTPKGTISSVKDGDASPFPIVTDKGQFTIEECGYSS